MSVARHRWAVAGFCVILVIAGLILAQTAIPSVPAPGAAVKVKWVRTRDGWQVAGWEHRRTAYRVSLHPVLVATLVGLVSATLWVAFPQQTAKPPGDDERTSCS
jgi:hypothetical protein